MHLLRSTVSRWGPGVVAVVTLLALLYVVVRFNEVAKSLQHQIDSRNALEIALRAEVQTWQAYVANLANRMSAHGVVVPDAPAPPTTETNPKED